MTTRTEAVEGCPGIFRDHITNEYGFIVGHSVPGQGRRQIRRRGFPTAEEARTVRDSLRLLLSGGVAPDDALAMLGEATESVLARAAAIVLAHLDEQSGSDRLYAAGVTLKWLGTMHDAVWTRLPDMPPDDDETEWAVPSDGAFT